MWGQSENMVWMYNYLKHVQIVCLMEIQRADTRDGQIHQSNKLIIIAVNLLSHKP